MPFDTPAGPAVHVDNICDTKQTADRLGVHINSIYHWAEKRDRTGFPLELPSNTESRLYDYSDVYEWFMAWVKKHPRQYPVAYAQIFSEVPA